MKPYDTFKIWKDDHNSNLVFEYEGRFFDGSPSMATLIECMAVADTEENGIKKFCELHNYAVSQEVVASVLDECVKGISSQKTKRDSTFIWSKELIPSSIVCYISRSFRCLFSHRLMCLIVAVTIVADILYMTLTPSPFLFNSYVSGVGLMVFLVMIILSSFIHELGHAAACSRFGINSGGIGVGLYINFPVLYTDVTKVWRLPVKQRCVVNLGGVYFQSFILLFSIIANYFYESDYLKYLILALNMGMILTLNPFFKFDGYWIASDLLGVGNLRQKTRDWMMSIFNKCNQNNLSLPSRRKYIFLSYAVLSNFFFLFFFIYVIPIFLINFFNGYPSEFKMLIQYVNNRISPPFALVRNILSQTVFIVFLGYWLWGMINNVIIPMLRRNLRK